MSKFLILFLALFMTAGVPLVHAGDDVKKPAEEEAEPECD